MNKNYTIDMLNEKSVSVKTQDFAVIEGREYPIGQPHRKAYVNSVKSREEVINELPQAQQNAIFAVWGDTPTVDESIAE
jgi:hypothetical protein